MFYSFSFCMNPKWTSLYPEGPEIVKYLQEVCDQYQIVDKIQLNTDVRVGLIPILTFYSFSRSREPEQDHEVKRERDLGTK
jgi:cation diffusion facilitator CzcD-associated flavoprotein CzcO